MNGPITAELLRSSQVIASIDPAQIRSAADLVLESIRNGGQIIFMGNGGSSADAQHIAAEFSGRYLIDRPAMAGVCLSNIAPVTAIGNDYSYDLVFKRQIEAICRKGDVVVGLSTSGNSKNVILAMEEAAKRGAKTISFTGDCGKMREMADVAVVIPTTETPRVQEGYLVSCHTMCGIVEREMFGDKAVLVDRDDTLAKDVPYCSDPKDLHLFPGVPEAIARLNDAGYKVLMVTNQSGINRGYFTEETFESITAKMKADIAVAGGRIDDVFFCPHRPEDDCDCRKPRIGMGIKAIQKHGLNPDACYMVGDHDKDIRFGEELGMKAIKVSPEFTFADAVDLILKDA